MDLPVAIVGRVAFSDALLQGGHDEGVHKVTLALVCLVTISGWATENSKKRLCHYSGSRDIFLIITQFFQPAILTASLH